MCVRLWGYHKRCYLENVQLAACFPFLPPTPTCLYTGSGFKGPEDLGICFLSTTLPTSYHTCIHLAWHLWSFTVLLHCCIAKTENMGWELAQLVQYDYTRIRTHVQIPRDYAKVWVLQCTPVIPVLIRGRTETGQSRDPVD